MIIIPAIFLLISIGGIIGYNMRAESSGYLEPVTMTPVRNSSGIAGLHALFEVQGWITLHLQCSGNGILQIYDLFQDRTLLSQPITGSSQITVILPHEGSYVFYSKGHIVCSGYFSGIHPTARVQNVYYTMGGVSAFILAFLLWRWWR